MNTNLEPTGEPAPRLTSEGLEQILGWWQQRLENSQMPQPSTETTATTLGQQYRHLMEVFCVVKAGGVAGQLQAAQALLQREQAELEATLTAAIAAKDSHKIDQVGQELEELQKSVSWRVTLLKAIHPEDEALVQSQLARIEQVLRAVSA
ncbi:MAG: hypothetical protein ACTS3T_21395 [Almyronema sp.]